MAPRRGSKARGRGAAQAFRLPTAGGPPSQSAPPFGQGVSWQTPVAPAKQSQNPSSGSSSRGSAHSGRGRGGRGGAGRVSTNARGVPKAATAQRSAEADVIGKDRTHDAIPETPSSHWVTLHLQPEVLTVFPLNWKKGRWWRHESASESFVTLKTGHRAAVTIAVQHSKRDPPKPLTLQSPSLDSPLPSLTSVATSTSGFGIDLEPPTPLESQLFTQPTVASQVAGFGAHPSTLPQPISSPKTNPVFQQGLLHSGPIQAQLSGSPVSIAKGDPGPQHFPDQMAPVKDTTGVQAGIKEVIQNLYDIQSQTHGYVPETADLLVDKMTDLAQSLNRLQNMTSLTASPNNPIHKVRIAPEIVDYVDDGRNPDIFTRDFVENVQRGNAVINGKQKAFKDFSEVFAQVLKEGMPDLARHVDRVMDNAGFGAEDASEENKANTMNGPKQNGENGG
jgi:mediator of RNA polymerase II transcription subunit 10